jgi:hypothetical protein
MFAPMFLLFSWSLFQFIDSMGRCACTKGTCPGKMIWKGILRLRWIYLIPVVIFGAISYHLHPLTGSIAFVLFTYFVVMFVIKRKELVARRYGAYVLIMLIGALLTKIFLPSVWNDFTASLIFFDNHWSYVGHIMRNYWHPIVGGILVLMGSWYLIKKQEDERPGIWISVTFFVTVLSAILIWNRNVGPQYIFFVQTFGLILAAAGVYAIAQYLQKHIHNKHIFVIILVLGAILVPFYGYFMLENNTYHITASADTANYRKVFDYVKRNAVDGDAMITRNFRNYYWSGLKMPVLDFGSERSDAQLKDEGKVQKITVVEIQKMTDKHPTGWVVFSDNDRQFITKEARQYFQDNFEKIDDSSLVRGKVSVYRWGE